MHRPRLAFASLLLASSLALAASVGWMYAAPQESPTPAPAADQPLGAAGDGRTDDTAALEKQLSRGRLYLPRGVYRITRTLEVPLSQMGPVEIRGAAGAKLVMAAAGPAVRITGGHAGTADPASAAPETWERERFPLIAGFEITGAHPEADGIEAAGTMQLTIDNMLIRQVRHGIRLHDRNRNVLIADSHIYDNRGVGIWLDRVNLHQTNIGNCHISYNRKGGIVVRGGEVRNIHITGCDIEGNMSPDAPPTANVLFDCAEGSVAEAAITGCTIQHDSKSPDSANVRILGRGRMLRRGEPLAFQCGHVTIADNVLSDVRINLDLQGVRGATVSGNTLWQGYDANLRIIDCQQLVLSGNLLERNPLYGYTTEASNSIVIQKCQDVTLQGLHVQGVLDAEAGVHLEDCSRIHMHGCTILDCDRAGLKLRNVRRSAIHDNVVRDDRMDAGERKPAIVLEGDNAETQVADNSTNSP